MTQIKEWSETSAKEAAEATKEKQIKKFNNLLSHKFGQAMLNTNKVVQNFSKRSLTEDEENMLALGLNYAVISRTIPTYIIAAIEVTSKQLDTITAEKLRAGVSNVLQSTKALKSNLPSHLR